MNELVTLINNVPVLNTATISMIVDLENKKKEIEESEKIIRNAILLEMKRLNVVKIESDELLINYIEPTDKETFDSKKFKEENPDMYDNYVKMSPVKESIRIKVK